VQPSSHFFGGQGVEMIEKRLPMGANVAIFEQHFVKSTWVLLVNRE